MNKRMNDQDDMQGNKQKESNKKTDSLNKTDSFAAEPEAGQGIEAEYQELVNQINTIQQELEMLNSQRNELERSIELLGFIISKHKKGESGETKIKDDTLIPIASGIYAKASQIDTSKLFVNVGKKVMVKKSPEETLELLKKRRQEFEGYEERLKDFYNSLANQLNEIENLMRQQNV